ncbi:MAG: GTPase HflX [Alphaproteobacteria bacterium]
MTQERNAGGLFEQEVPPERALVVHPEIKGRPSSRPAEAALAEIISLTVAISLDVRYSTVVPVRKVRPATLLGAGVVEELKAQCELDEIRVVIINAQLTPGQQRNLERALDAKVIDRTGLILEIFGARARTAEGRLQVELAQLSYQRTRLVRSWTHLERQRGGAGFMGGPGERQLELDRRLIDDRIIRLKKDLVEVQRTRALHRSARKKVPYPVVALVGYTNAGKSTLFNRLTHASVLAADQLFATLDPTMRSVKLPGGRTVILSDTVGFISDLPTQLVAAFRATLEEVTEADLLLHVRDCADPDTGAQKRDVEKVLEEIGLSDDNSKPMIEVLNKADLLAQEDRALLAERADGERWVVASALTGDGCTDLMAAIDARLAAQREIIELDVEYSDGKTLAWLYRRGQVLAREDHEASAHLTVALDPADIARLERASEAP